MQHYKEALTAGMSVIQNKPSLLNADCAACVCLPRNQYSVLLTTFSDPLAVFFFFEIIDPDRFWFHTDYMHFHQKSKVAQNGCLPGY